MFAPIDLTNAQADFKEKLEAKVGVTFAQPDHNTSQCTLVSSLTASARVDEMPDQTDKKKIDGGRGTQLPVQ